MQNHYFKLIKFLGKRVFFPGLDLHTRCRYRFLPRYFKRGSISTLDAGCGNGALSYAAYKLGNFVLGITNDQESLNRTQKFFSTIEVKPNRMRFKAYDLYNLQQMEEKFDQIICSETLEHIKRDDVIIKYFYQLLRRNGVLHLCSPFGVHPENISRRTNTKKAGGHLRDGYTLESYKSLLEPAGFKIVKIAGLGSPLLVKLDILIRWARNKFGDAMTLPIFLFTVPLQYLDFINSKIPFSLYVQAIKKEKK